MDIFNVANFQEVIAVDQNYTYGDVVPIKGATADQIEAMYPDVEKNPNFGNPIAYQRPRMFRFGVRLTF